MREIKFRFWNEAGKHYHYDQMTAMECLKQQSLGMYDHEKEGCAFEQYTGLKDINGKEIYDGDILDHEGVRFDAAWDDVLSAWMCWPIQAEGPRHLFEMNKASRIVGNIHENRDLLGHITIEAKIEMRHG